MNTLNNFKTYSKIYPKTHKLQDNTMKDSIEENFQDNPIDNNTHNTPNTICDECKSIEQYRDVITDSIDKHIVTEKVRICNVCDNTMDVWCYGNWLDKHI